MRESHEVKYVLCKVKREGIHKFILTAEHLGQARRTNPRYFFPRELTVFIYIKSLEEYVDLFRETLSQYHPQEFQKVLPIDLVLLDFAFNLFQNSISHFLVFILNHWHIVPENIQIYSFKILN